MSVEAEALPPHAYIFHRSPYVREASSPSSYGIWPFHVTLPCRFSSIKIATITFASLSVLKTATYSHGLRFSLVITHRILAALCMLPGALQNFRFSANIDGTYYCRIGRSLAVQRFGISQEEDSTPCHELE